MNPATLHNWGSMSKKPERYKIKAPTHDHLVEPYANLSLRELAIVRQASLEDILSEALHRRLLADPAEIESFLDQASFGQLTDLAYHTGIIDKQYRDLLGAYRRFRNICAHREEIDLRERKASESLATIRSILLALLKASDEIDAAKLRDFEQQTADLAHEGDVRILLIFGTAVLEGTAHTTISGISRIVP